MKRRTFRNGSVSPIFSTETSDVLKDDAEVLERTFIGEKNQIAFDYSSTMPAEYLREQLPEGCPISSNIIPDPSSPSKHSYIWNAGTELKGLDLVRREVNYFLPTDLIEDLTNFYFTNLHVWMPIPTAMLSNHKPGIQINYQVLQ